MLLIVDELSRVFLHPYVDLELASFCKMNYWNFVCIFMKTDQS